MLAAKRLINQYALELFILSRVYTKPTSRVGFGINFI